MTVKRRNQIIWCLAVVILTMMTTNYLHHQRRSVVVFDADRKVCTAPEHAAGHC